jgi:hypothetical protein
MWMVVFVVVVVVVKDGLEVCVKKKLIIMCSHTQKILLDNNNGLDLN